MNKIVLVTNYPLDNQQSMQRYASALQLGLSSRRLQVIKTFPKPVLGKINYTKEGIYKWLGYIDKYLIFISKLHDVRADLIHICDHGNAMYVPHLQDKNHLITCHDVLAIRSALGQIPQNPTSWTGKQYQDLILKGLNRAKHVVCVSHKTREELLAISTLKTEQTSVIHNSLNYPFRQLSLEEAAQRLSSRNEILKNPFVLHVGDNKWYKNRSGVLRIFARYRCLYPESDLNLLLAGRPLSKELEHLKNKLNLSSRIIQWINPNTEQLEALYSTAQALLFPSLNEGFGWPVIEAQACGCPVICSSNEPLPEVAGDGALTAPAEEEEELAQLLAQAIQSSSKRSGLIKKGLANVERFNPEKIIDAYIQLYTNLVC
ncbi:glycosyltransferase family 1 protein [Cyanosarcina cf. burmensis CCALA 770]|nr:glycosyltransferase family 1 protein [Cyanosarcina cf. burmensis CCALA 770]